MLVVARGALKLMTKTLDLVCRVNREVAKGWNGQVRPSGVGWVYKSWIIDLQLLSRSSCPAVLLATAVILPSSENAECHGGSIWDIVSI